MRPTPDEVIAGIRTIVKTEIAPALPKQAQPHLKRVMAVLRDGRWNEAAFDLLRENAAFADLARSCAGRIDQESISCALRLAAEQTFPKSFVEANAINRRLREALCHAIEAIRDQHLTTLDELCARIGSAMLSLRAAE